MDVSEILDLHVKIVSKRRAARSLSVAGNAQQEALYKSEMSAVAEMEQKLLGLKRSYVRQHGYAALKQAFDQDGYELEPEGRLR